MAGLIRATPETLEQRATEYSTERDNIDQVITKLDNLKNALEQEWDGQAREAFIAQYEELKPSFEKMRDITGDVSEQLKKTAEIIRETDQQIASQMGVQ